MLKMLAVGPSPTKQWEPSGLPFDPVVQSIIKLADYLESLVQESEIIPFPFIMHCLSIIQITGISVAIVAVSILLFQA